MFSINDYKSDKTYLYDLPEKKIFYSDFIRALKNVGIEEGDTLLVHSDILTFGKPNLDNITTFMKTLSDLFFDCVGNSGTIVMPTFSFSFTKGEDYNLLETPSNVGALTNYFRTIEGVIRTVDPIHSCAIKGPYSSMLSEIGNDTFGNNSIYAHLHKINAKIATFGTKFADNCFFHYIEQKVGVPYRYNKEFEGVMVNGNEKKKLTFNYYVRDIKNNIISDVSRFNFDLLEKKYLKKEDIGRSSIFCIDTELFYSEGVKALKKNINYFLSNN